MIIKIHGVEGKNGSYSSVEKCESQSEGLDTSSTESSDQINVARIRSEYQGKELAEGEKADVLGLSGLQTFPGLL